MFQFPGNGLYPCSVWWKHGGERGPAADGRIRASEGHFGRQKNKDSAASGCDAVKDGFPFRNKEQVQDQLPVLGAMSSAGSEANAEENEIRRNDEAH